MFGGVYVAELQSRRQRESLTAKILPFPHLQWLLKLGWATTVLFAHNLYPL